MNEQKKIEPTCSLQLPGIVLIEKLLRLCAMKATGLQNGDLSGVFGSYRYAGSTFSALVANYALHGHFVVPQGCYLTCYFHHVTPDSWCAGKRLTPGAVLVVLPGAACELMLGAQSRVSMVLSPQHGCVGWVLGRSGNSFGASSRSYSLFHPQQHAGTALGCLHRELLSGLLGEAGVSAFARLETHVMSHLVSERSLDALLGQSSPHWWNAGLGGDYPVLRKAHQFMRHHLQEDFYIREIATALQVSERRLHKVFEKLLHVSPARYLSLLRLHEAAHRLSSLQGRRLSVKSVALDCGYRHLSRFAAHYQRLFGEYPSTTLARVGGYT